MQNPIAVPEKLSGAFTPDRPEQDRALPWPFRPLVARTAERRTVFSVFTGEIGLADCGLFKAALRDLCTEQADKIILDFSSLTLSKSAVGTLVAFAAMAHGLNKRLYLHAASAPIRAVLKELELTRFFSYLETEEEIIATLVI